MDISLTPDMYTPCVDISGNYADNIPIIKHGLYCPCGSRKDKAYENAASFASHIKSKSHQRWLSGLNQNKANFYVKMLKNKEIVENQQKIITQLENKIQQKIMTIDYLSEQLTHKSTQNIGNFDLLNMD